VPLVADVGYGLDDLIAAVEQLMTEPRRCQGGVPPGVRIKMTEAGRRPLSPT
jgi:hypothetical protein